MPKGASPKREREYKELEHKFEEEGRYKGREEEVAALDVVKALMAEGLLAIPAGERVVRLLPPLNITKTEVDEAAGVLKRVLV